MDSSSPKKNLKKLAEIAGDTKKMEDLLASILKAIQNVDKSQDDTEDDVEELDKSIDYLSAAITKKSPVDISVDQSLYGRFAKPKTNESKTLNNNLKMSTKFNEKARWAKLAGLPKVEEKKQQLDENIGGVASIGAINTPFPTRKPNDYELAFEHFLGEMYDSKKDKVEEEEMSDAEKEKIDREVDAVRDDLDQISKLAKDAGEDAEDIKDMVDEAELEEVDGFGRGSGDGTEGFGNMDRTYQGMDEMYKKHGKDVVDEVLEMYHDKYKTK
jgi:hypothetical protein